MSEMHPIEQEELMAYLDGELPAERAATAAEHLDRCRECQSLAADLQGVSQRLMAWQVESADQPIPPAIATALGQPRRRTWRDFLSLRGVPLWAFGVAGVIALLIAVPRMYNHADNSGQVTAIWQRDGLPLTDRSDQFVHPVPRQVSPVQQSGQQSGQTASQLVEPAKIDATMIVRTAQLTLAAKELDKARTGLEDIVKRHRGYFGQLNVNAPNDAGRTLEATLRVPADQLDAVMAEAKKLGRPAFESQSGEEVTQQFTDLEARLSNARNTEKRLTGLLRERTGKLADVLAVETEIDRTRGEIERMEAERKSMVNRVDFATLTVKIEENYKAELQVAPDSVFTRFHNASVAGYRSVVESMMSVLLALLSYGPSLLLWGAVLFFPARFVWKRLRRA